MGEGGGTSNNVCFFDVGVGVASVEAYTYKLGTMAKLQTFGREKALL